MTYIEKALQRMGYRQPDKAKDANRWVKPMGFSITIAFVKERKISNHFIAPGSGEFLCWKSDDLIGDNTMDIERSISSFETYSTYNHGGHSKTFGINTRDELISEIV